MTNVDQLPKASDTIKDLLVLPTALLVFSSSMHDRFTTVIYYAMQTFLDIHMTTLVVTYYNLVEVHAAKMIVLW